MRIILGVPSSGTVSWTSATAAMLGSRKHQVYVMPSCQSGPNYNSCLVAALNECEKGHFDLHAQIHADLAVVDKKVACRDCRGEGCDACFHTGKTIEDGWLDIEVDELLAHNADFISAAMAIKDHRLVTSCGIGNPATRWNPWRRFTTKELARSLPPTFSAADIGYGDKYLIHSHALCVFDMRKKFWWQTDSTGCIRAMFNYEQRIFRDTDGLWKVIQDSEDWAFSRRLWELGAKSVITSKVKTFHHGSVSFENDSELGSWQDGDEDTASQWRATDPVKNLETSHASREPSATSVP